MSARKTGTARWLLFCCLTWWLPASSQAWEPNDKDLEAAVTAGDFGGYHANLSAWLVQKVPAGKDRTTEASLTALLQDPVVAGALARRQLISKVGPDKLGPFAKDGEAQRRFLAWLLKNTPAMELFLEGATPVKIAARDDNSWSIAIGTLETWKRIFEADPDSKEGLYLRLAMATALRPPGTGAPGSGQQKTPSDPLVRYQYCKAAHAKKELFPSFDALTVWELQYVVSSGASEADLTWGREMVNTWRPDYREGERVVDTTSCVWRRNSPIPHVDYKTVLDGGGKCGPRSSWSVFICQAFGIPAIGVGQPAHACVAYKTLEGWKVAYGRSWVVSKLEGMSGPEFVAGVEARERTAVFSKVEHLRWLASVLTAKDQAASVMEVAARIAQAAPAAARIDLSAAEKEGEMDADPGAASSKTGTTKAPDAAKPATTRPEPPLTVAPGVIHVEAEDFFENGGITAWGGEPRVTVLNCYTGGRQLHFPQGMPSAWVGYKINVPETGVYELVANVAAVNSGQALYARSFGAMAPVKKATASAVWKNMVNELGPQMAVDNNPGTRWAVNFGVDKAWIELDLGQPTTISTVMIDERAYEKVSKFVLEYKAGSDWKTILEGTTIGNSYAKDFPPVTAQHVRLSTLDTSGTTGGPTFWEFSVGSVQDGHAWISLPWTAGLWQTTTPVDIRLVKGAQTIWLFAPYQRGVSLRWFELKPKGKGS